MPFLVVVVDWGIWALIMVIVISSLLSWFNPDPRNPFVRFLNGITEPLLRPIRAVLPVIGGFDFSPLVAFLVLRFLQRLLQEAILRGM